jgi:hypothetical protein
MEGVPARPLDRVFVQLEAVVLHVDAEEHRLFRLQVQVVGLGRIGVVEGAVSGLPVHREVS